MNPKEENRGKGLGPSGTLAQSRNSYHQRTELLQAVLSLSPFDCTRLKMLCKTPHIPCANESYTYGYSYLSASSSASKDDVSPSANFTRGLLRRRLILRPGTNLTPLAHCNHRAPANNVVLHKQSSPLNLSRFHPSTIQHHHWHPLLPNQFPARRPQRIRSQRTSA